MNEELAEAQDEIIIHMHTTTYLVIREDSSQSGPEKSILF